MINTVCLTKEKGVSITNIFTIAREIASPFLNVLKSTCTHFSNSDSFISILPGDIQHYLSCFS